MTSTLIRQHPSSPISLTRASLGVTMGGDGQNHNVPDGTIVGGRRPRRGGGRAALHDRCEMAFFSFGPTSWRHRISWKKHSFLFSCSDVPGAERSRDTAPQGDFILYQEVADWFPRQALRRAADYAPRKADCTL
jgi:hypothetical protein